MSSEEGKISQYNEAQLKMVRIHECQSMVNRLRTNMLGKDYLSNKYNYEVVISELLSLLMEVRGKLTVDEKKKIQWWEEMITKFLEYYPPHTYITNSSFAQSKREFMLNNSNWRILSKVIFDLESFARDMLEEHGYGSFDRDEDEGYD